MLHQILIKPIYLLHTLLITSLRSPHPGINILEHTIYIQQSLDMPLPMAFLTKHTYLSEIIFIISKLFLKKSPGHDLITNQIIKHLPKKAIILFTYILNSILRLSFIPPTWKYFIIILIHKPGKPLESPYSYRPISLLPSLSKILEKVFLKRIYTIINNLNIIPNTQFGFKNKHSTLHKVHTKNYCEAVILDVDQVLDRVWIERLMYKLRFLPVFLLLTLKSFLTSRTSTTRCANNILSHTHPITQVYSKVVYKLLHFTIFLPQIYLTQMTLTLLPSSIIPLLFLPIQTWTNPQNVFRTIY